LRFNCKFCSMVDTEIQNCFNKLLKYQI
jgi:hypothetical protein